MVIPPGSSATAIQTSPTSVEVVVYGEGLVQFKCSKFYYDMLGEVSWYVGVVSYFLVVVRFKS